MENILLPKVIIFFQIVFIDIVMAADNAIIIGLIASSFATKDRKRIILLGVFGAFLFRVIFAAITVQLLQYPILKVLGGALLIWIIVKLIKDLEKELQCQISLELMEDPVILLDTYTYDRPKITAWFNDNCKSPYPNRDIKCESPNRIPLNLTNDNVYNLNEDEDLQSGGMKFALSRSKRLNKEIDELVRYIMQLESIKKKLQSANSILIRENSILTNKWNVKSSSLMIPNRTVKNAIDIIKNFKKTHNIIED